MAAMSEALGPVAVRPRQRASTRSVYMLPARCIDCGAALEVRRYWSKVRVVQRDIADGPGSHRCPFASWGGP